MDLIYIANESEQVICADQAGVDRIMVDLETLGKQKRQGHLDTVQSDHSIADIFIVRDLVRQALVMVRVNPIHSGSEAEIDAVVAAGADIVMLPMFKAMPEVETFLKLLAGRAKASLLLETAEALARAESILALPGIDEVHIGLNDLHMALGLDFMFEVLSGGLVAHLCKCCANQGLKYGFGGVARIGTGLLPAEDIISEHARLGSTQVILSRDFRSLFDSGSQDEITEAFAVEVFGVRTVYDAACLSGTDALGTTQHRLAKLVDEIAARRRLRESLGSSGRR